MKLIADLEEKYPRVSERRFRELLVEAMMEAGNTDPEVHEAVYWLAFKKLRGRRCPVVVNLPRAHDRTLVG